MDIKEVRIKRIKDKMNEHGMTSRDLAKKSGISESGISRILSGEIDPRVKTFSKIAEALKTDPVWLMGYDEPQIRWDDMRSFQSSITEGLNAESLSRLKSYADYLRSMQNNEGGES